MELEEDEARVCRLCGQCESIYIDVFGEEGTKRFLNFKIHSKINILINENDILPKVICVQCLGKLEFVCDFQEECLKTQKALRDQYLPPLSNDGDDKTKTLISDSNEKSNHINSGQDFISANITSIENDSSCNTEISSKINKRKKDNLLNVSNQCIVDKNVIDHREKQYNYSNSGSSGVLKRTLRSHRRENLSQFKSESQQLRSTNSDMMIVIQQADVKTTRKLRSARSLDSLDSSTKMKNTENILKIHKKYRKPSELTENSNTDLNRLNNKINCLNNKIQMPTNALNKVLSAITNEPGIDVSVKEPKNKDMDVEDISFTIELSKKSNEDSLTVSAKVFPDQGSCLVDDSIVTFLEEGRNEEVSKLVNSIVVSSDSTNINANSMCRLRKNNEDVDYTQNPEDLFKIDGEEIHVDDNVEQIIVNNQISYVCKLCQKIYERKDKCTVHVKTHLGIKQYMCLLCKAKFVCKSDVMKHIRCSHTNPRPILCSKCPKRFRSKFDLTEHMNVHKGIRPYQCADCEQSYHHKVSLQMHVKSHMPPQNLACEYCGKIFPYRTRLLSHIGSVHMKDKRNFRCRFCYNLYSSLSVLNEHIKSRHTTTYTCDTCGKTFKVASKYKAHVSQHSNPKPFACEICKNRYASKAFLNEHLLKHQGVRKHVCPKCGASFAQASHLAAHRHVHGEKKHACPECGKMFNRRDNMKVHRRRHLIAQEDSNLISPSNKNQTVPS